jgi:hypothetical protein
VSAPVAEQDKLGEVIAEVATVVEQARAIEVRTPEEASAATAFLSEISTAKRRGEAARKFLVDPLNAHVKRINAEFKDTAAPLDEADQLVRGKVLGYQREQQRLAEEQQARLDAERRAAEEAAEAERQRAAAEAAEAERVAREREEARQAQLREAANERAREIAAMRDDEVAALAQGPEGHIDVRLAGQEIESRRRAFEAREQAERARREAEEATQRQIAAASAPAQTAEVAPLAAANGSASVRKEWKATVVDESLVPREYWLIDEKKINKVVKAGVREIPGVKIEQVEGLSVRAAR